MYEMLSEYIKSFEVILLMYLKKPTLRIYWDIATIILANVQENLCIEFDLHQKLNWRTIKLVMNYTG